MRFGKLVLSVFSMLLCVLLLVSAMPVSVLTVSAALESDLTFELNSDGESYSVTGCDSSASGEFDITSKYNGYPVTI